LPRKQKQEGRKNSRNIGYQVELDTFHEFWDKGYLAIMVPAPKRKSNARFQQKGVFAKWDIIIVHKATIIQAKRRKKYMTKRDIGILKQSLTVFPMTELTSELWWRDNGLEHESL
jgi:hypothetical protein